LLAVLSNRLSERVRVPTPLLFLVAAALGAHLISALDDVPHRSIERLVTVALAVILFDGGMRIGWPRMRSALGPVVAVGVVGTFLTTLALAVLAHVALGLDWWVALLVGTAIAPTDPAVVFSVLGQREPAGRSGTILEGESGVNDPVGIALMVGLLSAGGVSAGALSGVAGDFALQMAVGGAVGLLGGRALLAFMRRVALPSEGLYPLRTLSGGLVVFGAATVLSGSGFLAVFVAGLLLGDARAPYKGEIERFHSALASLGEIVAFLALGLTIDLATLSRTDVWAPGLLIGATLAFVVRPVLISCSRATRYSCWPVRTCETGWLMTGEISARRHGRRGARSPAPAGAAAGAHVPPVEPPRKEQPLPPRLAGTRQSHAPQTRRR